MAEAGTHIFRVSLKNRRSVRRDIEIESAKTLADFAEAIVQAFDFDFDHAFGFYPETKGRAVARGRPAYELFADMDAATETRSVRKTKVAQVFSEIGDAMVFLFDYGDEWLFRVELTALGQNVTKTRYLRVLANVDLSSIQYLESDDEEDVDDV